MFWISVDKAVPAFSGQVVKIKVADFAVDYTAEGWYDHRIGKWYHIDGYCLHDNVYAWKHTRKKDVLCNAEMQNRMAKWE